MDKITTKAHCNNYADKIAKLDNRITLNVAAFSEKLIELKESNSELEKLRDERKKLKDKLSRFVVSKKGQLIFGEGYFKATTPLAEFGVNIGSPLKDLEGWDEENQIAALTARHHQDAVIVTRTVNKEVVEKFTDEEKKACGFVTGTSRTFFLKVRTDNDKPENHRTVTVPEPATVEG